MYSTKLKSDSSRYIAKCIVNQSGPKVIDFVVDTGARYTCCGYMNISTKLNETNFQNLDTKLLGGIVAGTAIRVYKYQVAQFTIGNVDMGAQDIWITFDERATDDVLGMDILKQVFLFQDKDAQELYFSKADIFILSKDEFDNYKKMKRNTEYFAKLEKGFKEVEQGKIIDHAIIEVDD